jgi:hypothetical protein
LSSRSTAGTVSFASFQQFFITLCVSSAFAVILTENL